MPIDVDGRFIFVHIPRTGGSSIEVMFELRDRQKFWGISPEIVPDRSLQHLRWRELKPLLPRDFVNAAYTFAIVRNPWDRFASEFFWRKRWFERDLASNPESVAGFHYDKDHFLSLDAFVDVLHLPLETRLLEHGSFDGHLETQMSFLTDEAGRVALDYVGRFENYEDDVRRIARRVGRDLDQVVRRQSSARDKDYRIYYSSYARDAVAAFYGEDLEAFGYTF